MKASALFEYCVQVYEAMEERSFTENLGPEFNNEEGVVYEGYTTKLLRNDLKFSVPYYTKILQELKNMKCIVQLRRGGSTSKSKWLLVQKPTKDLWDVKPRVATTMNQKQQQTMDMNNRILMLEKQMAVLMEKVFNKLDYTQN